MRGEILGIESSKNYALIVLKIVVVEGVGMTHNLEHPDKYKEGFRILLLSSRNKDGAKSNKNIPFLSRGKDEFDKVLDKIHLQIEVGDRIYSHASPRCVEKAARLFKERQLKNDYNERPNDFYINLFNRWVSCLSAPTSVNKSEKLWLIDCDEDSHVDIVKKNLEQFYDRATPYWYETKNGMHCLIEPFNKSVCSDVFRSLIHKNPMMLWAY